MALGNTPTRLTNIFLEANKSFALNIRFMQDDSTPHDLTDSIVRLAADAPKHLGGGQVLTLEAEHVDSVVGHVQFKLQASDLSLEPGEYAYDITLLAPNDFSVPVIKGDIVIGLNADEINDNVFVDNVQTNEDVIVLFGTSCDVEIRFDRVDLIIGPQGDPGAKGDPTAVWIQDAPPPAPDAQPPNYYPLWVDTDAEYTYAGYVYEGPEPPPNMPKGVLFFDNDETNIPTGGTGVLYVYDEDGVLVPVTRQGAVGPPGPPGPPSTVPGPPGAAGGAILSTEPPPTAGLSPGTMWVDSDSSVPPFDGMAGHTVMDEGVSLTTRAGLDFVGGGVTVTDDAANGKTIVTIPLTVGLQTRASVTKTTASLAHMASETGTITMAKGYRLYSIDCSAACRVRLYTTTAKRDADLSRAVGVDPTADHGQQFEFVAPVSDLAFDLTPLVDGFDGKATPDGVIPITITNMSGAAAAITVTLVWLRTE